MVKRASLSRKERSDMHASQGGICGCGCDRPLGVRFVAEHIWCVALGNEAKPDALFRADCAAEKTTADRKLIKRVRHLQLRTGPQARRARRKEDGKAPLMQGRGFDKRLRKRMDGRVEART